jgi:hypothetical protein
LKKVNRHLNKLKGGWKRKFAWSWAKRDQDTVRKLTEQLNGALSLFGISRTLAVGREVSRVHDSVLQTREDVKLVLDAIQHAPGTAPERNDKPDVLCSCGLKVKLYTARTEKNYGREFLRCPKPVGNSQCRFFRWIKPNDKPDVFCYCELRVKLYTSRTEENPGREFLRCPKPVGNSQCKFFKWI